MANILTYLDSKKPLFGIPYAFCRWYEENREYQEMGLFKMLYGKMFPWYNIKKKEG